MLNVEVTELLIGIGQQEKMYQTTLELASKPSS